MFLNSDNPQLPIAYGLPVLWNANFLAASTLCSAFFVLVIAGKIMTEKNPSFPLQIHINAWQLCQMHGPNDFGLSNLKRYFISLWFLLCSFIMIRLLSMWIRRTLFAFVWILWLWVVFVLLYFKGERFLNGFQLLLVYFHAM